MADPLNFVSVGMNKTLLIVGLGNVGKEYDNSRHNIGFAVLDAFVAKNNLPDWHVKKDLKCLFSDGRIGESRVICIKPTTMMNSSGEAIQAVASFYKIPVSQILVVHDELDVKFGQIRTRVGGEAAHHNGIKSIISTLGENFGRVRIGIGPKTPAQIDLVDFVLGKFSKKEQEQMPNLLKESIAILSEFVYSTGNLTPDTRSFII